MKLSLSGRIAETEHAKELALVDLSDLAGVAVRRLPGRVPAPVAGVPRNAAETAARVRSTLDRHKLSASMITPDARIARQGSSPDAGAILRAFEPVLEIARTVGNRSRAGGDQG